MSSKEEWEQAEQIIKETLKQAAEELNATIKQEEAERAAILAKEQQIYTILQADKDKFNQEMQNKQQNNQLQLLNGQLEEAIKNDDQEAIQKLMLEMNSI
ncbi:hypothetical protein AABM38_22405 [Heyndrickxia sp. MSNUG]|uniref:hypothetical protein n=1 Tax=Heyndrickxia sp. MSNUG TaxID=3136677 RepID=UPI003C308DBB